MIPVGPQPSQYLQRVQPWQHPIQYHQIGRCVRRGVQGALPVLRLHDFQPTVGQVGREHFPDSRVVINHKDKRHAPRLTAIPNPAESGDLTKDRRSGPAVGC